MELNIYFYFFNFIRRLLKDPIRKAYNMHNINFARKAYII